MFIQARIRGVLASMLWLMPGQHVATVSFEEGLKRYDRNEVFATPAIADGRIYIRTRSMLYAFGK